MSSDSTCFYCEKGKELASLMLPICETSESYVYLFKDQNFRGRCVVALKRHAQEVFELSEDERNGFFTAVSGVAKALNKLFKPDKINYCIYGDKVPHFHMHIVPKHVNGPEWGKPFSRTPMTAKILGDREYDALIQTIREELELSLVIC